MGSSFKEISQKIRAEVTGNIPAHDVMERIDSMHRTLDAQLNDKIVQANKTNSSLPLDLWDIIFAINGIELFQTLTDFYNHTCINERNMRGLGPWSTILESGCGSGKWIVNLCRSYKCKGIGIDNDPRVINKAERLRDVVDVIERNERPPINLKFQVADAFKLPFKKNSVDICFSEGVIEHADKNSPDRLKILKEMARVASDAVLIITNDAEGPKTQARAAVNVYDYIGRPAKETPYTKLELEENLAKVGLKNISVEKYIDAYGNMEYLLAAATK